MTTAEAAVPAANLFLGVGALIYLIAFTTRRRGELPVEVLTLHLLAMILLVGLLATSAEQLFDHDATVLESMEITAVKLAAIGVLYRLRKTLYRTGTRHDEAVDVGRNKDEDDPEREIQA